VNTGALWAYNLNSLCEQQLASIRLDTMGGLGKAVERSFKAHTKKNYMPVLTPLALPPFATSFWCRAA